MEYLKWLMDLVWSPEQRKTEESLGGVWQIGVKEDRTDQVG